jgi:hypothetical protein
MPEDKCCHGFLYGGACLMSLQGVKPVAMRLRVTYLPSGAQQPVVDQVEITNFPAGL